MPRPSEPTWPPSSGSSRPDNSLRAGPRRPMIRSMPVDLWTSPAFVEEARAWVADRLAPTGVSLAGEWEQPHARAWSSAIRFETTAGRVWFKVNGRGSAYESRLVPLLSRLRPGLGPDVLASDLDRAWTLVRDAGEILRSRAPAEELWSSWELVLAVYAEAQLALSTHREELLGAGLPLLGPDQLVGHLHRLLDDLGSRSVDDGGLGPDQSRALAALAPSYAAWCAELAASPLAETVQHDDLHSANVCWQGDLDDVANARIIDWGDASVGHPFGTMLATLNSMAFHVGKLHDDGTIEDVRVLRARDAYLEPFTSAGTREELLRWVTLARLTGCVTRAITYESALVEAPRTTVVELDFPVRGWLLELLEPWAVQSAG